MEPRKFLDIEKVHDAIKKMTPETGANLVGVDDFEPSGEELYLVGHFETVAEAEAAKAKRLAKNPDEILHVYTPDASTTK